MGSASAQLDGGPLVLKWHETNGTVPHQTIAHLRGLLNRTRGRDCPEHLWDPDKRHPELMKKDWLAFLQLRSEIRRQVAQRTKSLPAKYEGLQWVDLQGRLVSLEEAAANYLRYLPPELVPSEAAHFLPSEEVQDCQKSYKVLAQQVEGYIIPDFDVWRARMEVEQEQHQDAANALHQLGCLRSRFGDFTLEYRTSRLRQTKLGSEASPEPPYDLAADIKKHAQEPASLTRTVGPIERAMFWLWYHTAVPKQLRSPLDGNVIAFLTKSGNPLDDEDAVRAFNFVRNLRKLERGAQPSDPDAARKLAQDIVKVIEINGIKGLGVTLNILRAVVLSEQWTGGQQHIVRGALKLWVKQALRLDDEYEEETALLAAIQAQ